MCVCVSHIAVYVEIEIFFQREIEPHAEIYCPVCDGVGVCVKKTACVVREWRIDRNRVIFP